jgi:hypothetical protein
MTYDLELYMSDSRLIKVELVDASTQRQPFPDDPGRQ